jgi:hypothetical protein
VRPRALTKEGRELLNIIIDKLIMKTGKSIFSIEDDDLMTSVCVAAAASASAKEL